MGDNPKWLVLINPRAGRRPVAIERVRSALVQAGVEAELAAPSSAEGLRALIAETPSTGVRHIAVVGGDGTSNLAANAILDQIWPEEPVLGVLPAGTGCDLLRTFGLPQNLEEAALHLATPETYRIDMGRLEGEFGVRHFLNVAQAGVGAAAAQGALRLGRTWGKARYPLAFLGRLPGFPSAAIQLQGNDKRGDPVAMEGHALAVIFANGQFFAGGWNVAPRANMTDGRLDVQTIDTLKRRAPALVPKIIRGVHAADKAVRRYSWTNCRLETKPAWPIEADGDLVGNTPVDVSVLAGALQLKI
ncbi:MAG: diacylglycerol/lipid kinase family protein [Acidimicrobiia bacterium]